MEAWMVELEGGDGDAAWNLFERRYRRLILATIRRLLRDADDVMDVFASVCAALAADNFARLRRYSEKSASGAAVSTWLVIVVRNLTIDWLRKVKGRRRPATPSGLSDLHREMYEALCFGGLSPTEAFEQVRSRNEHGLSFPEFLREIRLLTQAHPCPEMLPARHPEPMPLLPEIAVPVSDPAEVTELARRLAGALATQPADVRIAVQLFVVDELRAAEVALVVGWPNAKAVYNRVHRALEAMRATLEREGIERGYL
ncbi:MAG TPA: sigma-70 family RNA polymerase sigma factor [Gemmatimonadales bacterium]|nr:sigma-70 family RNA polymerase sigma factor [Gemmatimonadales bacterium]